MNWVRCDVTNTDIAQALHMKQQTLQCRKMAGHDGLHRWWRNRRDGYVDSYWPNNRYDEWPKTEPSALVQVFIDQMQTFRASMSLGAR